MAKLVIQNTKFAPVIVIMDENLGNQFEKLPEKKRGPITALYGKDFDFVKMNMILNSRFNTL